MGKFDTPIMHDEPPATQAAAIKIDPNGRYLFVVESDRNLAQAEFESIKHKLQEWWDSGKPIGVVASTPAMRFWVERVRGCEAWEYLIEYIDFHTHEADTRKFQEWLNEKGRERWELCSLQWAQQPLGQSLSPIVPHITGGLYYAIIAVFKRQASEPRELTNDHSSRA